jgi:hypothetical protein
MLKVAWGTTDRDIVLWTFYRDGRCLNCEIRQALDGSGFQLIIRHADGRETREQFTDTGAVNRRALEIQSALLDGGWFVAGDPRR